MNKKGRFYIQIKEIFDNGFALGSIQDYVNIMNDLDKQNENKGKQIVELQGQLNKQVEKAEREKELDNIFWKQECDSLQKALTEKDKEIDELKKDNDWYSMWHKSSKKKLKI